MILAMACRFLILLGSLAAAALGAEVNDCPIESPMQSTGTSNKPMQITFVNDLAIDVTLFWVDFSSQEVDSGLIGALTDRMTNSYEGHFFRMRTASGALIMEYKAWAHSGGRKTVYIKPCGKHTDADYPLWDEGRAAEFEALAHDHDAPCLPANPAMSANWSCVKYWTREDAHFRNRSLYGFQPGEVAKYREYQTFDTSYTAQIGKIPKITPVGAGYLKMSMSSGLKELLLEWYKLRRRDAMTPHDVIPGGYTNNDKVLFHKVDLDRFREVQNAIIKEMQQVLQWWTGLRLRHTSTFGVRIYRRDSMLIDHVDRMDTHLASAVLQVHQEVDSDGGWPLEVLLPSGRVGEVYLQPGEMVLYEGAWLRHGRPMRFKGNEFANVFTHFAPLDWKGPDHQASPSFYGYVKGRCDTIADEASRSNCREPTDGKYAAGAVDLNYDVHIPPRDQPRDPADAENEAKSVGDEL
mmetsp:Transcript_30342/g.68027  ORF Transcript_30342/g.68027 Transcript_30342/m.68027 type:complete len:465 (+) Transcript_30342:40-1434(+)